MTFIYVTLCADNTIRNDIYHSKLFIFDRTLKYTIQFSANWR